MLLQEHIPFCKNGPYFKDLPHPETQIEIHATLFSEKKQGVFIRAGTFIRFISVYRKNSKNWDTLNYYCDCTTNGIVGFYSAILRSKDADRITNRVDTGQTAP